MFYFLKKNYILLFTSFLVGAFFLLIYSLTEVAGYQPISPLPGLEVVDTGNPSGLIQYFNRIFVIFISIVAVLGVIKLMLCGFQYMTSEAISSKEEAKKCMTGVFGGLFLVLISVLVLQTINPSLIQLTFFDTLQQRIGAVEFSIPDFSVDNGGEQHCSTSIIHHSGAFAVPRTVCGSSLQGCETARDSIEAPAGGHVELKPCIQQS